MVNDGSTTEELSDRRARPRGGKAAHAEVLGSSKLNPFGDLHTLQHLSARLARNLRTGFEPLARQAGRCWAEPLSVQRFNDYLAERGPGLAAWAPLQISPGSGQALIVLDGHFVFELLDLFFGGNGDVPSPMPGEFTPAAETIVRRISGSIAALLKSAWEPVARLSFEPTGVEANSAMLSAIDGDDAVIVTRFGIATGSAQPAWVDILYPVNALKPHGPSLNAKVHGKTAERDPVWHNGLTRAVMGVRFPVRSVLAEPRISLGRLLELKEGDVIPITIAQSVEVMVAANRLGAGTVGTSNGRAAIRLSSIEQISPEDFQ